MRKLKIMLFLGSLIPLLNACATAGSSDGGLAAAAGQVFGQTAAQKKAQARKNLAPACGTRTQWTQDQRLAVSKTMTDHANERGMQLIAPEWERLDTQVAICRDELIKKAPVS